jgi:ATP-binding cassette, subfamily G (WHITE), member 2, SNQ2
VVLGRPGSGCTTFLKVLANRRDEFHSVGGEVHYDAFSPEQIAKHYRGDLQYCPEDDVHFPSLTVDQTLRFAVKTRAPQLRITGETREMYIKTVTDILLTVFGLNHVRNTLVGDASIRGISGGEKKRVSITEALATRSLINSWDKYAFTLLPGPSLISYSSSTRGLDSSTALEFSRALRIATDIARLSTIVSIYQAAESLYRVFDKVCLIYDGKMAYYGPANLARQYFIDMGYEPANRQTTADFLVSVTDPSSRTIRTEFEHNAPRTAAEFADHYHRSYISRINQEDVESYSHEFIESADRAAAFIASARAEHAKTTSKKSSYLISIPMQTRAVLTRRVQILKGNMSVPIINTL